MPRPHLYAWLNLGMSDRQYTAVWPVKMWTVAMLLDAGKYIQAVIAMIKAEVELEFIHKTCNYIQGGVSLDTIAIRDDHSTQVHFLDWAFASPGDKLSCRQRKKHDYYTQDPRDFDDFETCKLEDKDALLHCWIEVVRKVRLCESSEGNASLFKGIIQMKRKEDSRPDLRP